jgi:methionine-gamma-lyase
MKQHFRPESLMMSHGYKPELSEGSIKVPIFQTSTFVFKNAEEGKAFFEVAYGLREKEETEEMGLIYSRLNNPDLEILENRLSLWDKADDCAVFESGMAAISTAFLTFLRPGDLLVFSNPIYGGTSHFINYMLPDMGIHVLGFTPDQSPEDVKKMIDESGHADKLAMMYMETPANPTNHLIDLDGFAKLAKSYKTEDKEPVVAVDNTYLGPIWQSPMEHGADLVLYSATKYIGGHSDVIAGACLGSAELMQQIKVFRTFLGNMASPNTGWLLLRSLETLKVRMDQQGKNASEVAAFLKSHPSVEKVYYLGDDSSLNENERRIFKTQCKGAGAMISFDIKGGEAEAFRFLNNLKLIKLAVSLGSTESLAQHPVTMTHAGVDPEVQAKLAITPKLVRLSIGVEFYDDLITDIKQALEA